MTRVEFIFLSPSSHREPHNQQRNKPGHNLVGNALQLERHFAVAEFEIKIRLHHRGDKRPDNRQPENIGCAGNFVEAIGQRPQQVDLPDTLC